MTSITTSSTQVGNEDPINEDAIIDDDFYETILTSFKTTDKNERQIEKSPEAVDWDAFNHNGPNKDGGGFLGLLDLGIICDPFEARSCLGLVTLQEHKEENGINNIGDEMKFSTSARVKKMNETSNPAATAFEYFDDLAATIVSNMDRANIAGDIDVSFQQSKRSKGSSCEYEAYLDMCLSTDESLPLEKSEGFYKDNASKADSSTGIVRVDKERQVEQCCLSKKQSFRWEKKFSELEDFKREWGHCKVSATYAKNQPLARWVIHQRGLSRRLVKGESSCLTAEKKEKLEILVLSGVAKKNLMTCDGTNTFLNYNPSKKSEGIAMFQLVMLKTNPLHAGLSNSDYYTGRQ